MHTIWKVIDVLDLSMVPYFLRDPCSLKNKRGLIKMIANVKIKYTIKLECRRFICCFDYMYADGK